MAKQKRTTKKQATIGNITCPLCGHQQPMLIPSSSCQAFYVCKGCNRMIAAKKSCCVFCDYGDRKCPGGEPSEHKK